MVEDEPTVRKVVRRMLEAGGYTVEDARNGAEALAIVIAASPAVDVVLSDVGMPEMGARVMFARRRERSTAPKVLLVSGYSRDSLTRRPGIAADADLLAEPFTRDALLRRVRAVLDAPRPTANLA